jgi:hypothetical protein
MKAALVGDGTMTPWGFDHGVDNPYQKAVTCSAKPIG